MWKETDMRRSLLVLIVAILFSGCGFAVYGPRGETMSSVGIYSQGGFQYYNNQLTILNATQIPLTVIVNGDIRPEPILPGESLSLKLWAGWANYGASRQMTIVVSGRYQRRTITAQKTVYVSTWNQQAEAWLIHNQDLY
jgi:hypothetical protein